MEANNNLVLLLTIISVVVMVISTVSAVIAVLFSKRSVKIGKESNRLHELSYYQKLMNDITNIREGFHSEVLKIRVEFPVSAEITLDKCTDEQKKALNDYWEIVFREYRMCKGNRILITEIEELWDKELRIEAFRSLKWRSFRESLDVLIGHKKKNPLHKEAVEELEKIKKESIEHFQ
jgi:hypothetical protein